MRMAKRWIARCVLALLLSMSSVGAAQATNSSSRAAAIYAEAGLSPTSADTSSRNYAERERKDSAAAEFRAGDSVGVYIGGSAGLLIVVLLVILLLR